MPAGALGADGGQRRAETPPMPTEELVGAIEESNFAGHIATHDADAERDAARASVTTPTTGPLRA